MQTAFIWLRMGFSDEDCFDNGDESAGFMTTRPFLISSVEMMFMLFADNLRHDCCVDWIAGLTSLFFFLEGTQDLWNGTCYVHVLLTIFE
jgi:hypothetical protein